VRESMERRGWLQSWCVRCDGRWRSLRGLPTEPPFVRADGTSEYGRTAGRQTQRGARLTREGER